MAVRPASSSTEHSLLLGSWSGLGFPSFQDELSAVWHKGLSARAGAAPERAAGAPHLTPRGSKTAATAAPRPHPLVRTTCALPGPPPQGYQSKHLSAFWFRFLGPFSLQSPLLALFCLSLTVLGAGKVTMLPPSLEA